VLGVSQESKLYSLGEVMLQELEGPRKPERMKERERKRGELQSLLLPPRPTTFLLQDSPVYSQAPEHSLSSSHS